MYLVQLLLPLYDNDGQAFQAEAFNEVRRELTEKFGGVTAYARAPARGLWKEDDGTVVRDEIVIYEVMVDDLDHDWWSSFREQLRQRFAQDELVIRALRMDRL
jgi:hypothetical protein